MDSVPPPGNSPGVRGAFDEESCRFILHQLGHQIVHRYPFNVGIREIHGSLFEEYGPSRVQIADALSVLHELFEDDGPEGDVWRSWRHAWRHRNDDLLNPYAPAIGPYVLPPPTSRVIRILRGANFLAPANPESAPMYDENRPSYASSSRALPSHPPGTDSPLNRGSIVANEHRSGVEERTHQTGDIAVEQNLDAAAEEQSGDRPSRAQRDDSSLKENDIKPISRSSSGRTDAAFPLAISRRDKGKEREIYVPEDHEHNRDSQQQFDDVTGNVEDLLDSDLVTFEMMRRGPAHLPDIVSLRPIYAGESAHEVRRGAGTSAQLSSDRYQQSGEVHTEYYTDEDVEGSSETTPRVLGFPQGQPRAKSELLDMSYAPSLYKARSIIRDSFHGSDTHAGPSNWRQEVIGDQSQLFLSDRAYVEERQRKSLSTVKSHTVEDVRPSTDTPSDRASLHSSHKLGGDTSKAEEYESSIVGEEVLSVVPREPISPTPGRFPIDSPSEDEISQIRSHKCKPNDHGEGVTCSRVSCERYPIDGHDGDSGQGDRGCGIKRTQPNQLILRGRNFLQHMPKFFRKHHQSQQTNQPNIRATEESSSTKKGFFHRKSKKGGERSGTDDQPTPERPKRTTLGYMLDGACDQDDTWPAMTSLDLNKALPAQPIDWKTKGAMSSQTGSSFQTLSHDSNTRPSTASTGSSNLSRGSSKKCFHKTAHALVHPETAESRTPSPLRQSDSDRFLVGSKYDPLASPKMPDTPLTFSSFNNANPFMDQYDEFIPPLTLPAIPESISPDPMKQFRSQGLSLSRSEGHLHSPKPLQIRSTRSRHQLEQSDGKNYYDATYPRGRAPSRDLSQLVGTPSSKIENAAANRNESRTRSRSPVKRFLGLGKSQSLGKIPQEKESTEESPGKKAGLRLWGDRLRHGFLTNTESKPDLDAPQTARSKSRTPRRSTFPVSVLPNRQAKIYCEIELMICIAANKFLKAQAKADLMSADSVAKVLAQWRHKNRPQVVEFQFDQATQRDLILLNINTFKFHGEAGKNPMALNATMNAWKVMAKEMSVRTFCTPDSVLRKHLHDTHKVLEMLGTGLPIFLGLQELQVEALNSMAEAQKRKEGKERRGGTLLEDPYEG